MRFHRYRCFGSVWPHRHAYGVAYVSSRDAETGPGERAQPFYANREHRTGRRHGGNFGVRRPLRYLSYQLDLDESQRRSIAAVLDRLKTEREQAALDEKKMVADLADLVAQPEASQEALQSTLSARVRSVEVLQAHIARSLAEITALLDPDQREEFAYLLRTGAFRV